MPGEKHYENIAYLFEQSERREPFIDEMTYKLLIVEPIFPRLVFIGLDEHSENIPPFRRLCLTTKLSPTFRDLVFHEMHQFPECLASFFDPASSWIKDPGFWILQHLLSEW